MAASDNTDDVTVRIATSDDERFGLLNQRDSASKVTAPQLSAPLIDASENTNPFHSKEACLRNFNLMAFWFSLNHACIVAVLAFAVPLIGDVGSYGSGSLYVAYTFSALCCGPIVVHRLGAKWALVWGWGLYMIYILAYPFASLYNDINIYLVLVGGLAGGFASGFIWSAQGVYFAKTADYYSELADIPREEASNFLSGRFAFLYLALELVVKVFASVILDVGDDSDADWLKNVEVVVFFLFSIICVVGTVFLTFIVDFKEQGSVENAQEPLLVSVKKRAGVTLDILWSDNKMQLMLMLNAAFGFVASFNSYYIGGVLVNESIGGSNVGYLTAIVSASASVLALFMPTLIAKVGRPATMSIGVGSWLLYLILIMGTPDDVEVLGNWGALVFIYVLVGIGRGVWEAVVKAVFSDFFSHNPTAGFAALHVQSGGSSGVGYFLYPEIGKYYQCLLCIIAAVIGLRDYILANRIYEEEQQLKLKLQGAGENSEKSYKETTH
jgi:MFS family permease